MLDVQTRDISGFSVHALLYHRLVGQCVGVQRRVEQHVERLAVVGGHGVDVLDLVDVDAVEERLVADAAQRVVQAYVDGVGVAGQSQAILQVGLGLVVLDLAGVDPRVEEREAPGDAVLFLFQ
ncbi:hypothetical protein N8K70_05415 [Microbacterium betulae]|uniref:Uncharacterized protein n=1 Tax=Microbacterium betulae TaxID=2981139 RepID=A0AA97FIB4_9MICO|nr:hypothetical protein [Microbacterium sp. AB]WOF24111.1 hypothetical protein N8K70_05415 [Microbacterium sp. AB]